MLNYFDITNFVQISKQSINNSNSFHSKLMKYKKSKLIRESKSHLDDRRNQKILSYRRRMRRGVIFHCFSKLTHSKKIYILKPTLRKLAHRTHP